MIEQVFWLLVVTTVVYLVLRFGFEYLGYWLEVRQRKKVWKKIQKKHMDLLRKK